MVLGFGGKEDKSKSRGAAVRAEDPEEASETSPLLGAQEDEEEVAAAAAQQRNGSKSIAGSRPQSAVVRHGRGLLSEDGDAGSLEGENGAGGALGDAEERNGNDYASDDDQSSGDEDQGFLGWRRRNSSSSNAKRRSRSRRVHRSKRQTAGWIACYVFLGFLAVAFIVFAVIHVWIGRFMSEQLKGDAALLRSRAQDALIYRGPDSVKILDMDSDSTTVQVQMRMGIDVRTVFGWNGTADTEKRLPFSRRMEKKLIGWATRRTGQTSMDLPEPVQVSPLDLPHHKMLYLATQEPLTLPLHFPQSKDYKPDDLTWLRNVTITVPMEIVDPDVMATFVNASMAEKQAKVHVRVPRARVTLGRESDRGWLAKTVRRYGGQEVHDIELDQTVDRKFPTFVVFQS
jgi:hypothetical protein